MSFVSAQNLQKQSFVSSKRLWSLGEVAGRFVEISSSGASAALTIAFGLVREAQERGEPVGWVTSTNSVFYPPDAADNGTDLAALVVIRLLNSDSIPPGRARNCCAPAVLVWWYLISARLIFPCRFRPA